MGSRKHSHFTGLLILVAATFSSSIAVANTDESSGLDGAANTRAEALLEKMTQEEKLLLVHGAGWGASPIGGIGYVAGIPRLRIPAISYLDSAAGPNIKGATPLPSPLALAASWDVDLSVAVGGHVARELRTLGFAGGLGGGINLIREPRNGRSFEYLGEDPVLAGEMLAGRIRGTRVVPMLAVAKHFALNDQETDRFAVNAVIQDRPLRELYLRAFEIAVIEGRPDIVMCAYNQVNGEKSCENKHLITDILKREWGFPGYVQSDWSLAINDTVKAAVAGTDEEQPGSLNDDKPDQFGLSSKFNQSLARAVQHGSVAQSRLDDMVLRKLRMLYRSGLMDSPPAAPGRIDESAGDQFALRVAQDSIVLLKNDVGADRAPVLPFTRGGLGSVAVIGGHADAGVISGGGSAQVPPRHGEVVACRTPGANILTIPACANWYASSPLAAMRAKSPGTKFIYSSGDDLNEAIAAAEKADVAVVFATQYVMEQRDLPSLSLPDNRTDPANQGYDQNALIEAVAARAKRTVVVLETGTAVTMPWLSKVNAVLEAWYPGNRGGQAIADVLFGDVDPSGKLPLTFPNSEKELPQAQITPSRVVYDEGLLMGYRRYDALRTKPLFAFGHGLSYTRFAFSAPQVRKGGNGDITVRFRMTNVGKRAGAEVAQVYAALPASAGDTPKRLVAFTKVNLRPNEARQIEISIPAARLAVWKDGWEVPEGETKIFVGGSSDLRDAKTAPILLQALRLSSN